MFCFDLGDLGSVMGRLDGTDAESVTARGTVQNLTRQRLERLGSQMELVRARIDGKIAITIIGYQPGVENTKPLCVRLPRICWLSSAWRARSIDESPRGQQRLSEADSVKLGTGRMTETLIDDLLAARSRPERG